MLLGMNGLRLAESFGTKAFTPLDIPNLAAWYDPSDAATVLNTAGAVDQLTDKSGNARHLLSSTTARPTTGSATSTLGKNMLAFNGSSNIMQTGGLFTLNQPNTVFVVAKSNNTIGNSTIFSGNTMFSGEHLIRISGANWGIYAGLEFFSVAAANTNQIIHAAVFNSTSSEYYQNGVLDSTGNAFTNPLSTGITIGARPSLAGFFNGNIGEILDYNGILTPTQIAAVIAYLTAKW